MDLGITGTGYTPQPAHKAPNKQIKNKRPQTVVTPKRSEIQIAKHKDRDLGSNMQADFNNLEIIGKNNNKSGQKQENDKLKFTPIEKKQTPNNSQKYNKNYDQENDEYDLDNAQALNSAGFTDQDIQNIYGNNYQNNQSDQLEEIQERVVLSGGFKIPNESLEKRANRIRNMQKQPTQEVSKVQEEINKRMIMKQMGVQDKDMDEYFDMMDERVYDKQQDPEVHQVLESQVESKIESVHQQREMLLRRKAELEREKAMILAQRQQKLDRLYGKKTSEPIDMFAIINEQQYEESGQLQDDFNQKSKQQQYLEDMDNNLNDLDYKKPMQQNYFNQNEQQHDYTTQDEEFDHQNNQENGESFEQDNQIQPYDDEQINDFIYNQHPDFDKTEEKLNSHRQKMQDLEEMYKNRKEIQEKQEKEQQKLQDKIQKGILRAPVSKQEQEQRQYEEEFKKFVQQRRKQEERNKMKHTTEKKEFELFQSTSPNPIAKQKQTVAAFRENISSLYPEEIQKQLRKQAREGDNINEINLTQSKYVSTQQGFHPKKNDIDSEMLLLQSLFEKLDKGQKGKIEKLDFAQELLKNQEVCDLYNIQDNQINKELKSFKSQNPNTLTLQEMVRFLKQDRKIKKKVQSSNYFADEIKKTKNETEEKDNNSMGNCLLAKENVQIMKQIFDSVDKNQDWVIKRSELIQTLREDVRVARMLHLPAVYLANIDKQLTTDRVLYRIEKEEFIGDENQRKNKEFITWTQFLEYFTDNNNISKKSEEQQNKDILKSKHMKLYSQMKNEMDDQNLIELDDKCRQVLKEAFDKTEKQSEIYVNVSYFIQNVKLNKQYTNVQGIIARTKAADFDLQEELFFQVLDRMEEESDEFIEYDEIMDFFTRRGRPKGLSKNKKYQDATSAPRLMKNEDDFLGENKKSFGQKSILKKSKILDISQGSIDDREYIDAYDSDPETFYNKSQIITNKPQGKQTKLNRSVSNQNYNKEFIQSKYQDSHVDMRRQSKVGFNDDQQGQLSQYGYNTQLYSNENNLQKSKVNYKDYGSQEMKNSSKFRVTKPEPYKFDERENQRKMTRSISQRKFDEMIQEKEQKEKEIYSKTFKANPVPAHVKQDLYKQLMHNQEQRRNDVKANSIAITLSREKPFSFYARDIEKMKAKKKNKWEREEYVFKANKVPWFCSVPLYERINNEEQLKRQERVAKEAQKIMQMSKLPHRMEMHEQQKRAQEMLEGIGTINEYQGQNQKTKDPVNLHCTFQPPKAKEIPDFEKLQRTFQDNLDKKRSSKRPTVPQPFGFQETRKAPKREYLDRENQLMKQEKEKPKIDKIEYARKVVNKQPTYMPPSTKKFEQYVEKQKKEKEEKQKQLELEEKKKKQKEEKTKKFAKKFHQNPTLQQDNEKRDKEAKEKKEQRENDIKQNELQWKEKKKGILKKAEQEYLLIERPPVREKQMNQLKALNRMHQIMVNNGATQKDIKEMFSKEELNQLDDLKFLKKRYPKYFDELEKENEDIALKAFEEQQEEKDRQERQKLGI